MLNRASFVILLVACTGAEDDSVGKHPRDESGDSADDDPGVTDSADSGSGETVDSSPQDEDRDGYTVDEGDCDDGDASVHPGAEDACGDGVDQDCDAAPYDCTTVVEASEIADAVIGGGSGFAPEQVRAVMDLDGDLVDDVAVSRDGTVYLAHGPVSGLQRLDDLPDRIVGEPGDVLGWDLSSAGDLDGDGIGDLMVGAYGAGELGEVYLFTGPVVGEVRRSDAWMSISGAEFERNLFFGYEVDGLGDVNGDGLGDVLAHDWCNEALEVCSGRGYLLLSPLAAGAFTVDSVGVVVDSSDPWVIDANFGGAGDVNGDGLADYSAWWTTEGWAAVMYGTELSPDAVDLADFDAELVGFPTYETRDYGVGPVVGGDDLDGDGHSDLLVSNYTAGTNGYRAGAVYLVPGPIEGTYELADVTTILLGESEEGYAGGSLSLAGDVDGDGSADILVGGGDNVAYLVHGPLSGIFLLEDAGIRVEGERGGCLGERVSGDVDLDADGLSDIVVCDSCADGGGLYDGAAYVLYGSAL